MKYDLHIHTKYSKPCGHMEPATALKAAKKRRLNGIAICDHHTIKGALEAQKLNRDRGFEVIVGEEISTEFGDILLYYVKGEIQTRKLAEVLREAKRQGCIVAVPHPFRGKGIILRKGFRYPLEKLGANCIEAINGRNVFFWNWQAAKKADELKIAKIAGSDAHYSFEVGRAYTVFEGSLREAIRKKKTGIRGTTFFGLIGAARRLAETVFD